MKLGAENEGCPMRIKVPIRIERVGMEIKQRCLAPPQTPEVIIGVIRWIVGDMRGEFQDERIRRQGGDAKIEKYDQGFALCIKLCIIHGTQETQERLFDVLNIKEASSTAGSLRMLMLLCLQGRKCVFPDGLPIGWTP